MIDAPNPEIDEALSVSKNNLRNYDDLKNAIAYAMNIWLGDHLVEVDRIELEEKTSRHSEWFIVFYETCSKPQATDTTYWGAFNGTESMFRFSGGSGTGNDKNFAVDLVDTHPDYKLFHENMEADKLVELEYKKSKVGRLEVIVKEFADAVGSEVDTMNLVKGNKAFDIEIVMSVQTITFSIDTANMKPSVKLTENIHIDEWETGWRDMTLDITHDGDKIRNFLNELSVFKAKLENVRSHYVK